MKIPSQDGSFFDAYLAVPDSPPAAAIVVLHEIFGMTASIRAFADTLAGQGFLAVIPDLFWRQERGVVLSEESDEGRSKAVELMQQLVTSQVIEDISAAAKYFRQDPRCSGPVGAVGFCLGGRLAFIAACTNAVDVAIAYYPTAFESVLDATDELGVPVLVHLAKDDALCPPTMQEKIIGKLGENPLVALKHHAGAGHAFARQNSPSYVAAAAHAAHAETFRFLNDALDGTG